MEAREFYDEIAPLYHLVYADWEASIGRQAAVLDALATEVLGPGEKRIRDVACGIGTQSLGLAALGHEVVASDASPASVERARREAAERGLAIELSTCDMRRCDEPGGRDFDVVLAADNAVPHLLTDDDIVAAFRAMHRCLRPGGAVLVSVRDYAEEDRSSPQVRPYGLREAPDGSWIVFQVWRWEGRHYDVGMYFVREAGDEPATVTAGHARYYAVDTDTLERLLRQAGFEEVRRVDGRYFQPVLVGRRGESPPPPGER